MYPKRLSQVVSYYSKSGQDCSHVIAIKSYLQISQDRALILLILVYTFVATNSEIEINDMFSTLLKAMLATIANSLGLGSKNLNSENLKSWITLQNAIYHLIENDPRYKIIVWDCDNRTKFSNHEIDERLLTLDENIIGNNVSISFEWSSDPSYRLILIRKNFARRIQTPVEESEGTLNSYWAKKYNWDEKKWEKVWRDGEYNKARVNRNLYVLINNYGQFGLTHNYERESRWLDFIDYLFEKNIIINHHNNELPKAASENVTAVHSSSASSSDATMADESKVVVRDCPNVSMLERTVDQLIQFVVESRVATHSIVTDKDMIGTLERLPQFKKLPSKYQMEVLDIVETEYRLTRNYDHLVRLTDRLADNEKFSELSAERTFSYISRLDSFAGLSEHERNELECYVQLKFPK